MAFTRFMRMLKMLVLGLLLTMYLLDVTSAIQFELYAGKTRCVSEDVNYDELIVGKYTISPEGVPDVMVKVYDPSNREVHSRVGQHTGKFALTSQTDGEHKACFTNTGSVNRIIDISIEIGETSKDYDQVAKKDNLKPMEVELKRIEDMVQIIYDDMHFMKTREEEMRATNDATNSRVLYLTVFSVFILVILSGVQIIYLKRFFVSKKMI